PISNAGMRLSTKRLKTRLNAVASWTVIKKTRNCGARSLRPTNNAPPARPIRNSATTRLNEYVLDPMIIVSTRVHATCVLIVTKPDAKATSNHNDELPNSTFWGAGVTLFTDGPTRVRRWRVKAIKPTMILITAAMTIVARTPNDGNNTNPAMSVPRIAPARLHV